MVDNISFLPLLEDRRKKLDQKPFDWAAWKKGTLLVLKSAFGENSAYYKQLNSTEYEYSSWSLRDTSGSGDPVKSSCAELLDICMVDLQTKASSSNVSKKEAIANLLKKYLSAKSIKAIEKIMTSDISPFEKEEKLFAIFSEPKSAITVKILSETVQEIMKD